MELWQTRFNLSCSQGEVMELMGVPALIEPLAPQLSPAELEDVVRRARDQTTYSWRSTEKG